MPRFITFLRALNVGGHRVKMAQLRALFEDMGFTEVSTFIASGNVIFTARSDDTAALEQKIAQHLQSALGYEVATFIRTPDEIAAIARHTPFTEPAVALNVGFLSEPLSEEACLAWLGLKTDLDDLATEGREIYWLCRKKQSESSLFNVNLEKILQAKTTFRGINTLTRLAAKYANFEKVAQP